MRALLLAAATSVLFVAIPLALLANWLQHIIPR